ncbi:MAG TPA: MASE4 domain-containing protein [Nocardioides sp.]|uniref:sensor histidine kinase n=1 Tax=uncultured Nocardioides sp. TaxID=198441 RepID=UPI0026047AA7|nr:MASE4 domain-containing protein [uncultured Nocardioides sp.]HRD61609.1 MASE4 domain-containing protein [Nocardioides sp.]HRI94890.1 MASE4 domain-containing protein [Nocardioides sp.]HRK44650.1 MASE4 domain-containing protein [Nocardioides sp.]
MIPHGRTQGRLVPVWVALSIPLCILAIWPVQHVVLPTMAGVAPLWCATVLVLDTITAALLISRHRSVGDLRLLILATAYATSAAAVILLMFSLPGVFSTEPTFANTGGAPGWIWLMRHIGPPVLIAAALAPWPARIRSIAQPRRRNLTAALVVSGGLLIGPGLLFVLLRFEPGSLPHVLDVQTGEFASWAIVLVGGVNAAAVVVSLVGIARRRDTTRFESWAVVAVVAWAGDVVLTLTYDDRYSVAGYGARALGVASSLAVVVALLHEMSRMQRNLTRGSRDLSEQVTQLVNAAQDRDHIVAVVSHELRTPLTGLTGYLDLLVEDEDLPPELRRRMHERSLQLARRLTLLSEDLLTRGTAQHGNLVVLPECLDLQQQVADCAAGFPGLEVRNEVPPGICVHADPLRVQQVLTNLVRNAQRHGAEPVTVSAVLTSPTEVRVSVADEGAGVPPEFVPHLFDRYSRSRTVSAHGAGLGLSVVQDLVRAHGGDVGYETGTRSFVFTLPAVSAPSEPEPQDVEARLTTSV